MAGHPINHVAKAKKTPLFRARSYDIVKYLVQKGANPIQKVRDERGKEKVNAVDHLMEFNPDAAMAIFDSCLDLDRQGNLIIDFMIFECNDQADPTDRKQFAHTGCFIAKNTTLVINISIPGCGTITNKVPI